jgi:signal transduction histidine kinase
MDEERMRRENILNIILIGSIAMLAILDGIILLYSLQEGPRYDGVPFVVFSALPAFFVLLYVLSRRGFSTLASYLLIATYFVSNSYAAWRWGATLQVTVLTYALIIVTATILRGTKFGFFTTGVIAAFIIPLWYAQFNGIIPIEKQHLRVADAFIFSIIYFLIMIVAWLYNREIDRSLKRAHESERALKEERDLLEVNIQKRTDELSVVQLEKVEQLKRFAELGQLSSGLFHDIFNLLNAISLRQEDELDPALATAFNTTHQIQNFMEAVRKQIDHRSSTQELFSLNKSIGQAIQLVVYKANKDHVVILFGSDQSDGRSDILYVNAPFKFHQVVLNLLLNAIESYEYLPSDDARDRIITVMLGREERTDGTIVVLTIEDNGCGMTDAVRNKIFNPFFTTKEKGKGIGIGLAMVKKIIEEDLGGTIAVESEPYTRSLFTIEFPLNHEAIPKSNHPSP